MSKLIKKGQWGLYIDYPEHDTEIINESGIKLPLGHAGFALVDQNGRSEYYDYGRYGYKGVGRQKNTTYQGNFKRRSIPNMKKGESSEDYAKRVGNHLKAATGEKVVVSIVPLPNYDAAKKKLNEYFENRSDYNALTNQTCAGVAADIIRTGRGFGGKLASGIGMAARGVLNRFIFGPIGAEIVNRFPSQQRPTFSDTYKFKKGGIMKKQLIPKAQFGTGIVKRGLRWIENHMAPTQEQTAFANQNRQRAELQEKRLKGRTLQDLQNDLNKLGYNVGAADNIMGRKTRRGIEAAKADGYTIDMKTFSISGKPKLKARQQSNNGRIIYLHYPDFISKEGLKGITDNKTTKGIIEGTLNIDELKVGHTALILLDNNNNATYYEYGRYNNGNIIGVKKQDKGNWRSINLPSIKPNENVDSYLKRVRRYLPERNENRLQYILSNDVNIDKAKKYITEQSNNGNRREYGITNTCATQANKVLRSSSNHGFFNPPDHVVDENSDLSGSTFNQWTPGGSHQYFNQAFGAYGDYVKEITYNK